MIVNRERVSNSTNTDVDYSYSIITTGMEPKMSLPPISSLVTTSLPSFKEVVQSTMPNVTTETVPIYPIFTDQRQTVNDKLHPTEPKGKRAVFISLFNSAIQKRPRRKFEEVHRIYNCLHPSCDKKYGALNHLNAHIKTQKHGKFRKAHEFKDNNGCER